MGANIRVTVKAKGLEESIARIVKIISLPKKHKLTKKTFSHHDIKKPKVT